MMIRLSIGLILVIGATMTVAGRDLDDPAAPSPEVTRLDTGGANGLLGSMVSAADAAEALPLSANDKAIEIALARTAEKERTRPAPAALTLASATRAEPAAAPARAEAAPAPAAQTEPDDLWYVTGNVVNLRSGPSTSNPVIGQVSRGDTAERLGADGGWVEIRVSETGERGYIFGKFLDDRAPS